MTVKLPEKAGFMPTAEEWDALVRIAENLAAQLVQRDAESLKATFDAHEKINQLSGDLYGAQMDLAHAQAERDAARAEVARLTAALAEADGALSGCNDEILELRAVLRQPAPARAQTWCECGHKWSDHSDIGCVNCGCGEPAPAQE